MTRQTRSAWALVAVTVLLAVIYTWFFLGWSQVRGSPGWPVLPVGAVLMAWLGALIVARVPGHRIGWLFVIGGASVATSTVLSDYDRVLTAEGLDLPRVADVVLTWLNSFFDLPMPALLLTLTFLLFPDGRLPSSRWRPALWATWTTFGLFVLVIVVFFRPENVGGDTASARVPVLGEVSFLVLAISVLVEALAAALSSFGRLRRSQGQEREQLRWLAAAAFAETFGFALAIFGESLGLHGTVGQWVRVTPLHVAFVGIPVSAGIAILRHRLYGIDVLLNRAIVLTTLAAFVASGYIAVVVTIDAVVGRRADNDFWPSLLAFVVVALAFQPVRRSVLRLADRVVYGRRAAPYEALADFSSQLGRAPSAAELLPLVAETIGRGLGARRTSVVLAGLSGGASTVLAAAFPRSERGPQATGDLVAGSAGAAATKTEVLVPVQDRERDEPVGHIRLEVDRSLTPDQQRLVDDLAQQAAMALRNLRLEAELSARVQQLSRRTSELDASRRHLVAARDDERHRLASALRREVVAHLEAMPQDLARLAVGLTGPDAGGPIALEVPVEQHIAAAGAALDRLRAISRGLVPQRPTSRSAAPGRTPPS